MRGTDLEESQVIRNTKTFGPGDTISTSNQVRPEASSTSIHLLKPFTQFLHKPLKICHQFIHVFLAETHTHKSPRSKYSSNVNSFIYTLVPFRGPSP